jgi:O-antigen/teichoic acid export membrane protein
LLFVVGVILLVTHRDDVAIVVLLYFAYHLLAAVFMLVVYEKRLGGLKIRLSILKTWGLLRRVFRLGVTGRLEMFTNSYPIVVISAIMGSYYVGVYTASYRFFTIAILAYQAIMLKLAPHFVRLANSRPERQRRVVWMLLGGIGVSGLVLAVVLILTGEWIITVLLGREYSGTVEIFYLICALLVPLQGIGAILGTLFIYINEEGKYLAAVIVSTLCASILIPLLTFSWGLTGTVYALSLSGAITIIIDRYFIFDIIPGFFQPLVRLAKPSLGKHGS